MDIKNFILKNKRIAICLIVSLGIGISGGVSNMPKAEYSNLVVQKEQLDNKIVALDRQLEESKRQVDELKVKKEEADRLAREEAERKAKEEAKAKAEAERKAKEEAERIAKEEADRLAREEAERIAQEQQNSNNYVSSGNNGGSIQGETPIGTMVWLSETGSKYHSINNCGRMNPSKARQVTLESAQSRGFGACSKCY